MLKSFSLVIFQTTHFYCTGQFDLSSDLRFLGRELYLGIKHHFLIFLLVSWKGLLPLLHSRMPSSSLPILVFVITLTLLDTHCFQLCEMEIQGGWKPISLLFSRRASRGYSKSSMTLNRFT